MKNLTPTSFNENSRMMVGTLLSILIVAAVIGYFVGHEILKVRNPGIHKMVMPNVYTVYLSEGGYCAWNFPTWPSKGIHSPLVNLKLDIRDSTNQKMLNAGESRKLHYGWDIPACTTQATHFAQNIGREELHYGVAKSGWYRISCDQKLVVVLVPDEAATNWLDNDGFPSSDNDLYFESKP